MLQISEFFEFRLSNLIVLSYLRPFLTVWKMWDGRIDSRRLKTSVSARGKQLLHASPSPSIPISPSFPVSPAIPIPPPFHVSPPFQPSPHFSPSHSHPLSPTCPAPSPPSHRHSIHPAVLPSSCPPHYPSFVVAPSVHPSLQHSPSFPAPAPRPTPAVQPSLHPFPPAAITASPGPRPSHPHPSLHPPSLSSVHRRGVCVPQELHRRYEAAPESTKTKALQTVIEMKVSICHEVL